MPFSAAKNSCRASTTSTGDAEPAETSRDLFGLALAHEPVLDEDGLQLLAQGPMAEHRDRGRIDAARQGVDRRPVPDGGLISWTFSSMKCRGFSSWAVISLIICHLPFSFYVGCVLRFSAAC